MNPNEYYRLKSAEIKEADVRLVAAWLWWAADAAVYQKERER